MKYRHVVVSEFGGPDVLRLEESELPEPAPAEVRVRVLAAGTGFTDTIIRQGQYVDVKDKPPFTLGYDWVGVIDKLGADVSGFELGQWVADMPVIGAYSEYLCVAAEQLTPLSQDLDPAEAVAMILSYTTAYQMLTRIDSLQAGQSILVHAAGGAVGSALLDIARTMDLKVYASASAAKHELLRSYGAIAIDYQQQDFVSEIARLSDGRGVDYVFDTIGAKNWSRSFKCLARGGKLVGFGALQLTTGEEKLPSLLMGLCKINVLWNLLPNGKSSCFYNIHKRRKQYPQEFKADLASLFAMLQAGQLTPAIAARRRLEDVVDVHRQIDAAAPAGKIVLLCNEAAELLAAE